MNEVSIVMADSVESVNELVTLLEGLNSEAFVAVDTEFTREKTFYPIPALFQFCINGKCYLADPIKTDITSVIRALVNTRATMLIFSGTEDYELIVRQSRVAGLSRLLPEKCIDVQLMSAFAGMGFNVGLQKMIATLLRIELDKSETRSDWEKRPLSLAQLQYAALDVFYLETLYSIIREKIDTQHFSWFTDEMREQLEAACFLPESDKVYLNVDKTSRLNQAAVTRLRYLAKKRYEYALDNNIALNRVITSKAMAAIASECPLTSKGLASCQMKWGAIREHGEQVIEWIKEAIALDTADNIEYPLDYFLSKSSNHDRLRQLKFFLTKRAEELNIAPEFLTQKKILADYFFTQKYGGTARLKRGWRGQVLTDLI